MAWPPFTGNLARALSQLQEDQFLIIPVKYSRRFVQFAAQGAFGMRTETTSNSYLTKQDRLDHEQIARLVQFGWKNPTGSPSEATPEKDPDGSPNFFCEFKNPINFETVAALAVRTFTEIFRVPHPGWLEYQAFAKKKGAVALPELSLRIAVQAPRPKSTSGRRGRLLEAISAATGISDLYFDTDGDIAIHYGSAITFAHLVDNMTYVRFYSPILREVEASPALFARLNDMNVNEGLIRFVFRNGTIYGEAGTDAVPFVKQRVIAVFERFCAVVDGIDSLLQEEFGGLTALPETMVSSARH